MNKTRPVVVGLGEALWDKLPGGARLGGAPANVAFHAAQMGADGRVVSRVGADPDGARLLAELQAHGLGTDAVQRDPARPTGTVQVTLQDGQPTYTICEGVAWDGLEWTDALETLAAESSGVCFGTLAQRGASRPALQRFVRQASQAVRVFDVNLRPPFVDAEALTFGFGHARVVKAGADELVTIANLLGWPPGQDRALDILLREFPVSLVAITRGSERAELHTLPQSVSASPPPTVTVDAVGAGDAFTAALLLGVMDGRPLSDTLARANKTGAFVAGQPGAMPSLPPGFFA